MPIAHNCSAQTAVADRAAAPYLLGNADTGAPTRRWNVKILFSAAVLAGTVGLLLSDWAGQAFPYL